MGRLTLAATQTDATEFLDLRQLQLASTQQEEQLVQLRNDLQAALSQAAAAVDRTASATASERDEPQPFQAMSRANPGGSDAMMAGQSTVRRYTGR